MSFESPPRLNFARSARGESAVVRAIWIPYWLIIAFTAVVPAIHLYKMLVFRVRVRSDLCRICGYNLVGNKWGLP